MTFNPPLPPEAVNLVDAALNGARQNFMARDRTLLIMPNVSRNPDGLADWICHIDTAKGEQVIGRFTQQNPAN